MPDRFWPIIFFGDFSGQRPVIGKSQPLGVDRQGFLPNNGLVSLSKTLNSLGWCMNAPP